MKIISLILLFALLFTACEQRDDAFCPASQPLPNAAFAQPEQSQTEPTTIAPGVPFAEQGTYDTEIAGICANGIHSFSQETLSKIFKFAENTPQGVKLIRVDNLFVSGRLTYTITGARWVDNLSQSDCKEDGFSSESRYVRSEGSQHWVEHDLPAGVEADGSIADGWYFLLVDITVESVDAAMDVEELGEYSDPYVFRADELLWLVDISQQKVGGSYRAMNIQYFSERNMCIEHEFAFRLNPGQTVDFSVGFLFDETDLEALNPEGEHDVKNLRGCNTTGNEDDVFINFNFRGD